MKKIFPKEILKLENAIAPETFSVNDEEILYFDRVNKHEGRFCKLYRGSEYLETEIDEFQGILIHEGQKYIINMDNDKTRIIRLSQDGEWKEIINLQGIYFDIWRNETGNYVCLGNESSVSIIKLLNAEGRLLKDIRPKNIIFASSIYLHNEYIYLGVVDDNNCIKVHKLNYLGSIEAYWDIKIKKRNRIVSKISIYCNYIFLLVEGRYASLTVLNKEDGSTREIFPQSLGIGGIADFDIYKGVMYILWERNIYTFNCDEIIGIEHSKSYITPRLNIDLLYYRYHIYSRGLKDQIKFSLFAAFVPSMLSYIFLNYSFFQYIRGFNLLRLSIYIYIIISYFIASIKNIFTMGIKEFRIEYLLSSFRECEFKKEFEVPLFFGLTFYAMVEIVMYPYYSILVSALALIFTTLLFYGIEYLCTKKIKVMNRDMVVELLEDSDIQTFDYIRKVVKNLRNNHLEKLYIEIVSNKRIDEGSLNRWKNSRNYIIGQSVIVSIEDNKIIAEIDLSKRNIKYSRFSIIMDYVCFIKSIGQIKEIQVEYQKKQL